MCFFLSLYIACKLAIFGVLNNQIYAITNNIKYRNDGCIKLKHCRNIKVIQWRSTRTLTNNN